MSSFSTIRALVVRSALPPNDSHLLHLEGSEQGRWRHTRSQGGCRALVPPCLSGEWRAWGTNQKDRIINMSTMKEQKMKISRKAGVFSATALCVLLASCSSSDDDDMAADDNLPADQSNAFALNFAATDGDSVIGCGDVIANLGIGGQNSVQMGDLRFYVGDLQLLDADGQSIDYTLDSNEFQYSSDDGEVSMIDLTDTSNGVCAGDGEIDLSGTERSNTQLTGMASSSDIAEVRFSVGVPQALMKAIISENTAEGSPSPLNELYWSWASGYRHFLFNFLIDHIDGSNGGGYLHIGSRGCTATDGENALETLDSCEFVNNPAVELSGYSEDSVIGVNITALLADVDFLVDVLDPDTREPVLDETGAPVMATGVSCHSAPVSSQPDCGPVFNNLGLNSDDGTANAAANTVFSLQ